MSLISDSLRRVAEQRAGRKEPPALPRMLAGRGFQHKKRLLLFLGLSLLLAGAVIGVVAYSLIQWGGDEREPAEAVSPAPQQIIFKKFPPASKPTQEASHSEPQPSLTAVGDLRTPATPRVVQVAIEQEPVLAEKKSEPRARVVERERGKQVVAQQDPSSTRRHDASIASPVEEEKAGERVTMAAAKGPERVRPTVTERRRAVKSGLVDLQSENTAGAVQLYRQAVAYQKAMKWQEAIGTYQRVLKIEPMSAEVYNNIGVCYEKQGKLQMAAKSYERAISINPRFYRSYNNLGIIYYKLKHFTKARAAYEQALQLNPSNSQSEINLALVYERLRRGELARRTLERVLVNDPENAAAHYNLARMLEEQGNPEQALTHYRQFLASNSSAYPQLQERVKERVRTLQEASSK